MTTSKIGPKDGKAVISLDGGETWQEITKPVVIVMPDFDDDSAGTHDEGGCVMDLHITVDPETPNRVGMRRIEREDEFERSGTFLHFDTIFDLMS